MSRTLNAKALMAAAALVFGSFTIPALAAPPEEGQGTRTWSRAYGVGACVNCPGGTGLMAGEDVGQGMFNAASGFVDAMTAPLRPVPDAPPPEVFRQQPPPGYNCWVDAGAGRGGYWAKCP